MHDMGWHKRDMNFRGLQFEFFWKSSPFHSHATNNQKFKINKSYSLPWESCPQSAHSFSKYTNFFGTKLKVRIQSTAANTGWIPPCKINIKCFAVEQYSFLNIQDAQNTTYWWFCLSFLLDVPEKSLPAISTPIH